MSDTPQETTRNEGEIVKILREAREAANKTDEDKIIARLVESARRLHEEDILLTRLAGLKGVLSDFVIERSTDVMNGYGLSLDAVSRIDLGDPVEERRSVAFEFTLEWKAPARTFEKIAIASDTVRISPMDDGSFDVAISRTVSDQVSKSDKKNLPGLRPFKASAHCENFQDFNAFYLRTLRFEKPTPPVEDA